MRGTWRIAVGCFLLGGSGLTLGGSGAAAALPPWADRNGDGVVVIACLGDSNTDSGWQRAKPGGFDRDQGWCEQLARRLDDPRVRPVNMGVGGATIGPSHLPGLAEQRVFFDGRGQLEAVLRDEPVDVVLLAFGTNDVPPLHERAPVEIVDSYNRALRLVRSRGLLGMVALTPVVYPHRSGEVRRSLEAIDETNRLLTETFPPREILDFHSGATPGEYLDDLHMNARGQARRAETARRALVALAETAPPPAGVRALRWSSGHWAPGSRAGPSGVSSARESRGGEDPAVD